MDDTLIEAVREHLTETDKEDWCQRIKYGRCSTRKCLIGSDGKQRTPGSYDGATCTRYRVELALLAQAGEKS